MPAAASAPSARRRLAAALLLPLIACALLAAIAGGLLRAGVLLPGLGAPDWLGRAALDHGALMVCCFMGTVIGIERAVALRHAAAWLAPAASALATPALLAGRQDAGADLLVLAALAFVAVNLLLVRRQRAPHTWLLLASASAWLAGNALFAARAPGTAVLPWWFAFLVMTVGAERLEMTRLMRRRPGTQGSLYGVLAAMAAGAALSAVDPVAGGVLYGAALVLLAAWLLAFDIARRTLVAEGLPRYMAVCLLGGYLWLAIGGLAWAATALGAPARDIALHALGLGFLVSMMMGHAPVILPALARVKLAFGPAFYLPLAVLHLSLLMRFGGGLDLAWRGRGAIGNALAIAVFAAVAIGAARRWRRQHAASELSPSPSSPRRRGPGASASAPPAPSEGSTGFPPARE